MKPKRKHFVEFFSPGTFQAEYSTRSIPSWSIAKAIKLSKKVIERHGAKPYGFQFVTCICADPIPDGEGGKLKVVSKEVKRSGMHYLGGEILKFDDVPNTKENKILRSNMECNDMPVLVVNNNSWKWTAEFKKDDVVVDEKGVIVRRGNDKDIMAYRREKIREFRKRYA